MSSGRPWDGARDPNCDYFDDVMGDNEDVGIFHGGAMDHREKVQKKKTRAGLQASLECRYCNGNCVINFEWPELYTIGLLPQTEQLYPGGILPQGWKKSDVNATVFPEVTCNKCGGVVGVHFTPSIAQKEIDSAIESGVITKEWLMGQPATQQLFQLLQQAQGGAPHQQLQR